VDIQDGVCWNLLCAFDVISLASTSRESARERLPMIQPALLRTNALVKNMGALGTLHTYPVRPSAVETSVRIRTAAVPPRSELPIGVYSYPNHCQPASMHLILRWRLFSYICIIILCT